jgi:hypothetical protein
VLGIKPRKSEFEGGWTWALPVGEPKVLNQPEDAHLQALSVFGEDEHLRENGEEPKVLNQPEDAHLQALSVFGPIEHLRGDTEKPTVLDDHHEDARPTSTFKANEHLPSQKEPDAVDPSEEAQAPSLGSFERDEPLADDEEMTLL